MNNRYKRTFKGFVLGIAIVSFCCVSPPAAQTEVNEKLSELESKLSRCNVERALESEKLRERTSRELKAIEGMEDSDFEKETILRRAAVKQEEIDRKCSRISDRINNKMKSMSRDIYDNTPDPEVFEMDDDVRLKDIDLEINKIRAEKDDELEKLEAITSKKLEKWEKTDKMPLTKDIITKEDGMRRTEIYEAFMEREKELVEIKTRLLRKKIKGARVSR